MERSARRGRAAIGQPNSIRAVGERAADSSPGSARETGFEQGSSRRSVEHKGKSTWGDSRGAFDRLVSVVRLPCESEISDPPVDLICTFTAVQTRFAREHSPSIAWRTSLFAVHKPRPDTCTFSCDRGCVQSSLIAKLCRAGAVLRLSLSVGVPSFSVSPKWRSLGFTRACFVCVLLDGVPVLVWGASESLMLHGPSLMLES